jgi:beta-mannosidase
MSDCLSLPHRQGAGGARRLEVWESLWLSLGEGEEKGLPAGRGTGWEPAEVPGQRLGHEGQSALWYRCSFPRPDHRGRVLVRFGGAFLAANVWLNGRLLGSHYGYFAPFGFDISSHLADDNLLVVCCESPIETDLARKRHVMGFFNDGDSRPYPPSAYFSLPAPYQWEVPIGLWRPVELEYAGAVILDWLKLRPQLQAGDLGVLDVETRLRNLDGRDMSGEIRLDVTPSGRSPVRLTREYRVPGGLEQTLHFTITVPGARRWSPWRLGEPIVHGAAAEVFVNGRASARLEDDFGFRDLELRARREGWTVRADGRPFFIRGANYQPGLRLDRMTGDRFEEDIRLAKAANLDALRVHAHVLPEEFYRAADRAGMLVFADFPLTGVYAYHASAEETHFFEDSVREQVPEMVALLGNRPSIAAWLGHDDPAWVPANESLAEVHSVRQNYSIDQEVKALFERHDPLRPALAASGDLDARVRLGWSEGPWTELMELEAGLISEFGAQALPALDSPAAQDLRRRWPVDDDDPRWLYLGFQPFEWSAYGAGLPSDFETIEDFVAAGQRYQAWLVGMAIDQFRRRKFEPCWGAFVYQLVDPFPGIGFGLLDHARREKPAYQALARGMAPARLIIEPIGFEPAGHRLLYRPGASVGIRLIVVSDDPELAGAARLKWGFQRVRAPRQRGIGRLRDAVARRSYSGAADFALPDAADPAAQVERLDLPVVASGEYEFTAELWAGERLLDSPRLTIAVGSAEPARDRRRPVPSYLASRLLASDSLRTDPRGVSFELLNRARPAALTEVASLSVDGEVLTRDHILAEISGRIVPLPRRLDLPVGRRVRLVVDLGAPLREGRHRVELDLRVPGVASGRLALDGLVRPEELRPIEKRTES